CMHDNTWARALMDRGHRVTLIPTYTPIRVDEENLSTTDVFLGGLNVYLDYRLPLWRRIPRSLTHWLDSPWIINLATKLSVSNNASQLGALTLAMLDGESGPLRREIEELVSFVARELKPDVICFSNALLIGVLRTLRSEFPNPIYCTLQGDDVFLQDLPDKYRSEAIKKIHNRAGEFDGFLVHSLYYRDFMADYLNLPLERFHQIPLGIDLSGHDGEVKPEPGDPFTVGYFARVCPEKGLHHLVNAFRIFHARHPNTRLVAGGYLGKRDRKYFRQLKQSARDLGEAFQYLGSPKSHAEKVNLIKSFDLLSVPTEYHEPKGLPMLEALANGVPVVQPHHGAFPELIEATGGGKLVPPNDAEALADALELLMQDAALRQQLATTGQANVRELFTLDALAAATARIFERHHQQSSTDAPPQVPTSHVGQRENS
ncbi:MAG: glycosyltransferase family 4 protein, partial [Planctomycetaceae bacterium]|nr:glycosyltransferase family 4 protein [Planctomycetaceae bacterium]